MTPESGSNPSVRLEGIVKHFGPVTALAGAHLEASHGEVHAVLGENGAGKTTLMNILTGLLRPDCGRILVEGAEVQFHTPREAAAGGVGMVHQHFTLVPHMPVLENVALGVRSARHGLGFPRVEVRERIRRLSAQTGLEVDPDAMVRDLSVGARQRVEILKLLFRDPGVLVLDEPTPVLAPQEVAELFGILRALAQEGRTVLIIAHKLDEVLEVADRVTVLRDGVTVLTADRGSVGASMLAEAMVGRPLVAVSRQAGGEAGEPVARLRDVWAWGSRGDMALRGVDLLVRRGEIVGVAGVEGNGQRELALVLSGRLKADKGSVSIPARAGLIPQDRSREGVVPEFTLAENMALALHDVTDFRTGPLLRWGAIREATEGAVRRFAVRARSVQAPAGTLSGGNQQKLVVSRELTVWPDLLVAENPTRGLDVAATEFVHQELRDLRAGRGSDPAGPARVRDEGPSGNGETGGASSRLPPGVVLISTDLDDVLTLSDRVFVMLRGKLMEVPEELRTREGMGSLMLSGGAGSAATEDPGP